MSVEQVARDFTVNMLLNPEKLRGALTPDAVASGGVMSQPMPMAEALKMGSMLKDAMPDLRVDIQKVTVNGNQATVQVLWGGTQTGPLTPPMLGAPTIPPTMKKVSVKDTYVVTVQGDKVSHVHVDSPTDGGIPAALAQLGVKMPSI